ncbi:glycosyltransferase family 2 protein [Altererythrobacter sp. SALINAS58]|uniref:glycosyltransferase family 2 protein n=1 Tax=Alteripontixanthobacter muriae TaxID=2705546 RepID=UPI001576BB97|nr:glycosyltransferase family 2 protein [Alteripontixanthobacter muriae]NTZ43963.1 glycosyltransferase family 2 protein [Alteripontixanthobacter muriae]
MHQPESVTIIIPAFNAARFIKRAVASALQQANVAEVIVVDDASSDDTVEVVRSLAQEDSRVRLVRLCANVGPSAARNMAIRAATSAWIATLDADDAFGPGRIESLLQLARSHSAEMIADNLVYFDGRAQKALGPSVHPEPRIQEITLEKLFRSTPDGGQDYVTLVPMINRSFLSDHAILFDEQIRNGEDFDIVARCLVAGAKYVADLAQETYLYTSRASGTSQTVLNANVVVKQTLAWLSHPEFKKRPDRLRIVHERVEILRRRELDRLAGDPAGPGRGAILRLALRTPEGRRWLQDWVIARLRPTNS